MASGEVLCLRERVGETALDALGALAFDERVELPGGLLELGVGGLGCGGRGHRHAA